MTDPGSREELAVVERFTTLAEWLEWLEQHHPTTIELGLERVAAVARALNILPLDVPVVTVAGTNGKGSVVAALAAVLAAPDNPAKKRVGVYTSPHLLAFNERIVVAGVPASDALLQQAFVRVNRARYAAASPAVSLTYFEFTTLAALLVFAEADLDVVLLEVGLGGRLDAVNIVDADIAVITQVALDHQSWLGDDREQIGFEKAGILRPGQALVLAESNPPASVLQRADQLDCIVYPAVSSAAVSTATRAHSWSGRGEYGRWEGSTADGTRLQREPLQPPKILAQNLSAALQVAALLGALPEAGVLDKVASSIQPVGRQSWFSFKGRELLFDVAHNPAAVRCLNEHLLQRGAGGQIRVVFAAMADKDIQAILAAFAVPVVHWYLPVLSDNDRACDPATLREQLPANVPVVIGGTVAECLEQAVHNASQGDKILVFGSFYLVAEALQYLGYKG